MIRKQVPGSGEVWMVYDVKDRIVLTQDANMRSVTQKKWMYTTYDAQNRVSTTGLITDNANYNNLSYHLQAAYSVTNYPTLSSYPGYEELSTTFYDNYTWLSTYGNPLSSSRNASYDGYLSAPSSTWPYPEASTQSVAIYGQVTGSRVKILNSSPVQYVYTLNIYDAQGRLIQTQTRNQTDGTDILSTQYSWSGLPLMTVLKQEKAGTNAQTTVIVTRMNYDELWRLESVDKKTSTTLVNSGAMPGVWTRIMKQEYDRPGQLKTKNQSGLWQRCWP